jgi:hypothetical protein
MNKGLLLCLIAAFGLSSSLIAQTRLSLYEEFSGEHCVPCATANPSLQSLIASNASGVVHITYPTSLPTAGPLSGTYPIIANTRVSYYGITTVPQGRLNGTGTGSGTSQSTTGHVSNLTQGDITTAAASATPFNMSIVHAWSITGDTVTATVTVNTPAAYSSSTANLKLRVALVENLNYSVAPGINAEQSFPNTVRDMWPNAGGTSISATWTLGQTATYTITGKVARYINKRNANLVAWIQNDADQSVMQAAVSTPVPIALDVATSGVLPTGRLQCVTGSATVSSHALITNAGTATLTSARIFYRTDASSALTFVNWTGSLMPNATTLVALGAVGIPGGNHYIIDSVTLPNGALDINPGNTLGSGSVSVYNTNQVNLPIASGFEGTNGTLPTGWILYDADSNGRNFSVTKNIFGGPAGFGGSTWFLQHNNYFVPSGEVNYAILPAVKLPPGGSLLTFGYAHAQYSSESDKLEVVYSTDCGASWTPVWSESGSTLATAPVTTSYFIPTSTQWVSKTIDMGSVPANSMIAFRATSDYGNVLYIDNVKFEAFVGVAHTPSLTSASLYPNPATQSVSINLMLAHPDALSISLLDATGRSIKRLASGSYTAGPQHFNFETASIPAGLYMVQISGTEGHILKKITVLR